MARKHHPIIWIFNLVIIVLSLLSIACYFFAPFWKITVSYSLSAESLKDMLGDSVEIDPEQILPDGDIVLNLGVAIETKDLIGSLTGEGEQTINEIVNGNVDRIITELSDTLYSVAKGMLQTATATIVHTQAMDGVREMLKNSNPNISDEEIQQKLEAAGVTDQFIEEKTNAIIEKVYGGEATTDEIADEVVSCVREVYDKMQNSSDEDLQNMTFSEEDEESLRQSINDTISQLADENGKINPDELLANVLLQALNSAETGDETASAVLTAETGSDANGEEDGTQEGSATEELRARLQEIIMEYIPAESIDYIVLALRILTGVLLFSCLTWVYTILKIVIKFITRAKNPTVKMKLPIWLGWLPYMLLAGIPSLFLWVARTFLSDQITAMLPEEFVSLITSTNFSLSSSGWIAAVCALICFVISIFYMVQRRKIKKALKEDDDE